VSLVAETSRTHGTEENRPESGRNRIRRIGDVPEISRLKNLRRDILRSEYHLCTQKASLLTRYLREHAPSPSWLFPLQHLHFQTVKKSLGAQVPRSRWQTLFNNRLNALYRNREKRGGAETATDFAMALEYTLSRIPLRVYDHELIVGNPSSFRVGAPIHPDLGGLLIMPELEGLHTREQNPIRTNPEQIRELREVIFPFWFHRSVLARTPLYSRNPDLFNTLLQGRDYILTQFSGISHVTPDYPTVLSRGFSGIKGSILLKMGEAQSELEAAERDSRGSWRNRKVIRALKQKVAFYEAMRITTDAAIGYGVRWQRHLKTLTRDETNPERKGELAALAKLFETVPARPAGSFHEAVQSLMISHVILHQESFQHGVSFGRIDQYLAPYYRKDLEAGTITPGRAVEILGCFLCKAGEMVPLFFDRATEYFGGLSSASGITLGGLRPDGGDGVNDLSYLVLLAYDQVRLRQPNLHVRVSEKNPPAFRELCYDVLKKGGGLPAFFSDRAIVPALERGGIESRDAVEYSVVGCVEWGCPGKSFPAAGAVFINLPMALHLALHNGCFQGTQRGPRTGPAERFASMEDLFQAYQVQLSHMVDEAARGNDAIEKTHALHRPTPFLSSLVEGCIAGGEDVNQGGARYNSTGCQGVGLADVVDSLTAIEQAVFQEKRCSFQDLVRALDANFEQQEDLRRYLLHRVPKYGTNEEHADRYATRVSGAFQEIVLAQRNPRNGPYLPGFWSMTCHQGFGRRTPALPSGRLSGEPLANGVSPGNSGERLGPTASLASAARLDTSRVANGYALNQKFSPHLLKGSEGNRLLDGMIRGYFEKGGMQIQFNVVDPALLEEARNHPEKHPDLVVRVSGYSAYFNDLTDVMKDELIQRMTHDTFGDGCCL